jgi:glycerol-3-phosphate O-acyltransferase
MALAQDMIFVPVYIGYDRIVEDYARMFTKWKAEKKRMKTSVR